MGKAIPLQISLCSSCQHTKSNCTAGYELAQTIADALCRAAPMLEDGFEISGYSNLYGCPERCLAGWRATLDAVYFFGDVTEKQDLNDLVLLAQSIIASTSGQKVEPQELSAKIDMPVRVPAAMLVLEFNGQQRVAA
ncbi:DUF1636 family protein [uncultured Cohaesibacter sp.]|uniref:DUF1636 family protein n=1 Tax=uncultured Cohaesibacter sp. TaxID=1002546 RepID=UPI0029C7EEF0|nr:DUF1636 family protein [uncultured Cohaesibacter sp.]